MRFWRPCGRLVWRNRCESIRLERGTNMMQRPAGWNRGTTSTELLLAICLVGVLLFFAIPRYISQSKQGQKTLRDTVVISVRAGLARFDPPPPGWGGGAPRRGCCLRGSLVFWGVVGA